jgi:hypothetical protein
MRRRPSGGVLHRPLGQRFPGERRYITPIGAIVELCTLGEGPRGHEAPHHDIILKLVPNGVVVRGQPRGAS